MESTIECKIYVKLTIILSRKTGINKCHVLREMSIENDEYTPRHHSKKHTMYFSKEFKYSLENHSHK